MRKIMIFENTDILGYKLKQILNRYGMENIEVIKEYHPQKTNSDAIWTGIECIIVDLDNRNQDMLQLIKTLKTDALTKVLPIITLSGNASLAALKKAIKAGCTDFILKPFETETLINKLYKVCHKDEAHTETEEYQVGEIFEESAITLKWTKDFEIGVELIDEEHRKIIESYDKLYTMMRVGQGHEYYQELLAFLLEYVNTHFEDEEQLQLKIDYNQYYTHKGYHDWFRNRVTEIVTSHNGEAVNHEDLISISLFVKDWLLHHILVEDKKMKDYIRLAKRSLEEKL